MTVPPMAAAVSEPLASSSTYTGVPEPMPHRYEDGYHKPAAGVFMTEIPGYAAPAPGYTMPALGFTSLGGLRGPESCGGRSKGSRRSSNRSLTRSEIREALRGATSRIVGDLAQQIPAKLEPLIPPQASPTTVGVSPHRVQANHLVAGLTNTLGSVRSRPTPTPAVIPRSPFIPRTAQPPYSQVEGILVRPRPSDIGGVVVDEDAARCVAGSVVVVGEGSAGKSEALGALSTGVSSKGTSSDGPCSSRGYTSSAPMSTACFSFSFSLPSSPRTHRPLKAALKPFRESSPTPLKGTESTGSSSSGSPASLGAGAGLAGATEGDVVSAVSLVSILYFFVLHWSPSRRTGCTARGCRYAKTENLWNQKVRTGFHC